MLKQAVPDSLKTWTHQTWRKQWVVLRRSTESNSELEIVVGRGSQSVIHINTDDVIYRTESRTQDFAFGVFPSTSSRRANFYLAGSSETESQKWISTIRNLQRPSVQQAEEGEFTVSVVDNVFSRCAGLGGLHGILRITPNHVTVVDPATRAERTRWPWNTLAQFHVSAVTTQEDEGHICTVLTSSKFPAGVGRIHLFSSEAIGLTAKLLGKGRPSSLVACPEPSVVSPYRHHTFSFKFPSKSIKTTPSSPLLFPYGTLRKLSSGSRTLNMSRRLSRSEGNLRAVCEQLDRSGRTSPCSHDSGEKSSLSSEDSVLRGRVATGLLHAGFGLMLSTPGCSECDSESSHEYQRVLDESEDDVGGLVFCSPPKYSPPRRESGVSVASGVYEEIDEISILVDTTCLDPVAEDCEEPPPLPPRRGLVQKSVSDNLTDCEYTPMLQIPRHNVFLSRSADNSPLPSPPNLPRRLVAPLPVTKSMEWQKSVEESHYLPMSPGRNVVRMVADYIAKDSIEEPHYMVMASVNIT